MIFWHAGHPLGRRSTENPPIDRFLSPPPESLVKADPGTTLHRMTIAGHDLFLKLYRYEAPWLRWRARLFASRARREFEVLTELARRGVPTLDPVAYGEDDRGLSRRACFLVTGYLPENQTLAHWLARPDPVPEPGRGRLLRRVAEAVARMHAAGFAHGGLFPRNLIVGPLPAPDDPAPPVRVFDAPFGRFYPGAVPEARRAADLACLLRFSDPRLRAAERTRFLRWYLGRPRGAGLGVAGRRLARAALRSSAFTRSVRKKARFHLGWGGG